MDAEVGVQRGSLVLIFGDILAIYSMFNRLDLFLDCHFIYIFEKRNPGPSIVSFLVFIGILFIHSYYSYYHECIHV